MLWTTSNPVVLTADILTSNPTNVFPSAGAFCLYPNNERIMLGAAVKYSATGTYTRYIGCTTVGNRPTLFAVAKALYYPEYITLGGCTPQLGYTLKHTYISKHKMKNLIHLLEFF